jgi:hypothetical protein
MITIIVFSLLVAVMISGFGMFTVGVKTEDDPSEIETFDD